MEDVFDTTGRPPSGWMHAIFHGGPYGEDVGRCIPGPPAPEILAVPLPEGGVHVYRLWKVGSWSDPDDPIAVYNPDGPPVPPPLLTGQEKTWLREKRRRQGIGPIGVVALEHGRSEDDPDPATIEAMLAGLRSRKHLLLQRLTDCFEGDEYIQVLLREDEAYEVEYHIDASEHCQARTDSQAKVREVLLGWAADWEGWQTALQWTDIGHPAQAPAGDVPERAATSILDRPDTP
ncbi:hypothetical protein Snoj_20130 [Streptomyces nojiriensis]|uniref:Uncharacterized protein n=1 Tax=Streptomyces nojiriensis TaxID=66374 RepID=A0ABQ3SIY2_9ACTN|nr:hypothetical protein GCM10010205_61910 [Streptomyces nojiriensis]GHI68095.1 hypothetical protein Snoj_20130 [Streptomyces nojiriensis]